MEIVIANEVLTYANQGFEVLPIYGIREGQCTCGRNNCDSPGKHPMTKHGVKDATHDPAQIQAWLESHPDCNWAIATGEGLVVIDIDPRNGGMTTWQALCREHDFRPNTLAVKTGSGGVHYYFRFDGKVKGKLGQGIDVKAEGGYVLVPPSRHASGQAYEWVGGEFDPNRIAPMPEWMVNLLQGSNHYNHPGLEKVQEGGRHNFLLSEAVRLQTQGVSAEDLWRRLHLINYAQCEPPLESDEVDEIIAWATGHLELYPYDDLGHAKAFAKMHGHQFRYVHDQKLWRYYDGQVWRDDTKGKVKEALKEVLRMRELAIRAIRNDQVRQKAEQSMQRALTYAGLESVLNLAVSDERLAATSEDFDRNPLLLGVRNGVYDLMAHTLREAKPTDYITKQIHVDYDPNAKCPLWEKFLNDVFQGNQDLIRFVQRAVGYSLTGTTEEQVFFYCYGTGGNGKSVFFKVLKALFGDYAKTTNFGLFSPNASHTDAMMDLDGARLVLVNEVNKLAVEFLKAVAGGDEITGSRKYEHTRSFTPTFKVWLASNHQPDVEDKTDGFWRKVVLIPFNAKFEGSRRDPRIADKLLQELPGILNWAIEGYKAWAKHGLMIPGVARESVLEWRSEADPIFAFLQTCPKGEGYKTKASKLYEAYKDFCEQNNYEPITSTAFGRAMKSHGFTCTHERTGNYYLGIGLPGEDELPF